MKGNFSRVVSRFIVMAAVLPLIACGGSGGGEPISPVTTLQSIAVTPANPSTPVGQTTQFTATGTYSDNTVQNLTASVTWSSGTTTVATISSTGLASGVATGTSLITATLGSVSGRTTLLVGSHPYSTKFSSGYASYLPDNAYLQSFPAITGGVVVSGWHNPYLDSQNNSYPFIILGGNWAIWCVADNYVEGSGYWNENTTLSVNPTFPRILGSFINDYTPFNNPGYTKAQMKDWKFYALYIRDSGTSFELTMWSLISPYTSFVKVSSSIPYSAFGLTPNAAANFLVGGGVNGGQPIDMLYARVHSAVGSIPPSDAQILALSQDSGVGNVTWGTLWGSWQLDWSAGAPDFTDLSGNGRNLTAMTVQVGGHAAQLYQGSQK